MTSHRSEQPPLDFEISWRTEELGPETRRRLFEKVLPSRRPVAVREGGTPEARDAVRTDHPRRTTERR